MLPSTIIFVAFALVQVQCIPVGSETSHSTTYEATYTNDDNKRCGTVRGVHTVTQEGTSLQDLFNRYIQCICSLSGSMVAPFANKHADISINTKLNTGNGTDGSEEPPKGNKPPTKPTEVIPPPGPKTPPKAEVEEKGF